MTCFLGQGVTEVDGPDMPLDCCVLDIRCCVIASVRWSHLRVNQIQPRRRNGQRNLAGANALIFPPPTRSLVAQQTERVMSTKRVPHRKAL